jgi:hypothetical protein
MLESTDVASCCCFAGGPDFDVGAAAIVAAYWYDVAFHTYVAVSPGLKALSELEALQTGRVVFLPALCEVFHMYSKYSDVSARTLSFGLLLAQSAVLQLECLTF